MEKVKNWTQDFDLDSLKKMINMKSLPHLTDEERFKAVLKGMKNQKGFRSWLFHLQSSRRTKNIRDSKRLREKANKLYLKSETPMLVIIEGFTVSLAYAPQGSLEMALAYANRSAILLKVQLYEDALRDITRALQSGYPDRLKSKLFARRALCLKALHPEASSEIHRALENARKWLRRMDKRHPDRRTIEDILNNPKRMENLPKPLAKWNPNIFLNNVFEESSGIVGASSSIQFGSTDSGVYLEATKDIKAGEIIAIQEPFVICLAQSSPYTYCSHCLQQTFSGIPCSSCVIRIYCSEECRTTAWRDYHGIECESIERISTTDNPTDDLVGIIIRAFVRAVKEAGSLKALRERVKNMEKNPELLKRGFSGSRFDGTTLEAFFTLPTHAAKRTPKSLLFTTFISVVITFIMATKSKIFGEEMNVQDFLNNEWVTFVGGLVLKFSLILGGATCSVTSRVDYHDQFICGLASIPLYFRFTHSCAPNISFSNFGRKTAIFAQYPVKKGERLIACLGTRFEWFSKEQRQESFKERMGTNCLCIACMEDWQDPDGFTFQGMNVSPDVRVMFDTFYTTVRGRFELIHQGNYAVISKMLHDLEQIISEVWKTRKPPCPVLSNLAECILTFYSFLGIRHQTLSF